MIAQRILGSGSTSLVPECLDYYDAKWCRSHGRQLAPVIESYCQLLFSATRPLQPGRYFRGYSLFQESSNFHLVEGHSVVFRCHGREFCTIKRIITQNRGITQLGNIFIQSQHPWNNPKLFQFQ